MVRGRDEYEAHADGSAPPDLAAASARWVRVSDAIRAAMRARIVDAQTSFTLVPKQQVVADQWA